MSSPAAFQATYSDWKLVKTRGMIQVVFEVPLADADAAYDVLGGMPDASKERWFGIAAIRSAETVPPRQIESKRSVGENREWRDLLPQQQAGIRCEETAFETFLKEERSDDWHETQNAAECVRLICGVQSRSELATNHKARVIWHQLDEQFQAWKVLEHA